LTYDAIQDIQISWGYLTDDGPNCKKNLADTLFRKIVEMCIIDNHNDDKQLTTENELSINRFITTKTTVTISFLEKAVGALGPDLTHLTNILYKLGRKHKSYGVMADDFDMMGKALMFTIEKHLGEKWDINVESTLQAWKQFYDFIAKTMMEAVGSDHDTCSVANTSVTNTVRSESASSIDKHMHKKRGKSYFFI
jgi:hemoglobin-like flavoprotein